MRTDRSSARSLAAVYAALIVYATLHPFAGWRWPPGVQWSEHADEALRNQIVETTRIGLSDLEDSGIDWLAFAADETIKLLDKKIAEIKQLEKEKENLIRKERIPKENQRKEKLRARNAGYVENRTPPKTAGTMERPRVLHQRRVEKAAKHQL